MALPERLSHDDYDLALGRPVYGGHPSPLADDAVLTRAKELLLAGQPTDEVAVQVGYSRRSAFSDAFCARTGERPSVFAARHGVKPRRRSGGLRGIRGSQIRDRSEDVPLPRFASKRKKTAKTRKVRK